MTGAARVEGRRRAHRGRASRAAPAAAATSLPGKVLMRLEPHAIGAARRAPGARQRRDLGDERQDDDGGDGRGDPRTRRARASSTTAPARTWRAASRARCCRPRAAATRLAGDTGLFEVDEFWLGQVVDELRAARAAAREPLPRPARPLRRARHDRRPLGRRVRAHGRRPRPQRRRPDRRRPRPRARRRRGGRAACRSSASRTTRSPCARCSTPPTPSTAAAAGRRTATTRSTSGTSAATTATTAAPTARSRRSRPRDVVLEGVRGARFTLRTPAGERAVALPLPGLYNVYNALGAAALALALGAVARRRRRRPGRGLARVRPGRDGRASATASCRSCS